MMRWRWLVVMAVIGAYLLSFFHRVAPAAIAQDLTASFQINAASLGLLAATYFYVYTVMQIPAGVLADTLGPRKLLTAGGLVAGVGSLLFGLAGQYEWAIVGRTLVGLGVSVVFVAMLKLIAVWCPPNRFATVVGIAMFLGNTGSVLAGTPLAMLVQVVGWRNIFIVAGLFSLAFGALSACVVRDRPTDAAAIPATPKQHWWKDLQTVLRNRATWPGFFVNFGFAGSFFSFAGLWAVPLLVQGYGVERAHAAHHISLYFACFAVGALLIGRLSDHIGRRKPFVIVGCAMYCACLLVWAMVEHIAAPYTYMLCALMGLVTASFNLTWSCAKEVNPPALSGTAVSVVNASMFLGAALLQPLGGWLMDQRWQGLMVHGARWYTLSDYHACLWLHAGFAISGWLAAWWVTETRCKNIWVENKGKHNAVER